MDNLQPDFESKNEAIGQALEAAGFSSDDVMRGAVIPPVVEYVRPEPKVFQLSDFDELRIIEGSDYIAEILKRNEPLLLDERENVYEMDLVRHGRLGDDSTYLLGHYNGIEGLGHEFVLNHPDEPDVKMWCVEYYCFSSGEVRAHAQYD